VKGNIVKVKILAIILALGLVTTVVTKPETQEGQKPLTNADIIRMVKAGFGESIILNTIQTNESQFDVSMNALFELKNAGVSEKVIETMQFVAAGKRAAPTVSKQVTAMPPNNPLSDNQLASTMNVGVILIDGLKRLEMKRSQSDTKASFGLTKVPIFGKSSVKFVLTSNQAQLRVSDTTPEFEVTLRSNFNATDHPILLKASQKSDRREIEIARSGALSSSSGVHKDVVVPTTFEEIKQTTVYGTRYTAYRVKVVNPLPPGEYILVPQGYEFYDFGIDANIQNINSALQQNPQNSSSNPTNANLTITNPQTLNPANVDSVSETQGLPVYGSIADIKSFRLIYIHSEDAESRDRIIKVFKDAPQFQLVGNPQDAKIILEYKVLSRDSNMDRGDKDIRIKSQLSAIYINDRKRVVAWSDTAEHTRTTSGGIGFRTQHNEIKLTERFLKAMKN
jgi:hypothetical protein